MERRQADACDEKKARTWRRLLDAAAVFAHNGFAATYEIAEVAGFSKGAVYSNFASKEDLFSAPDEHVTRVHIRGETPTPPASKCWRRASCPLPVPTRACPVPPSLQFLAARSEFQLEFACNVLQRQAVISAMSGNENVN